jgi:hypothetical protein
MMKFVMKQAMSQDVQFDTGITRSEWAFQSTVCVTMEIICDFY